mmetsp:Transcript_10760/g.10880  ORF Transcript_10760/g.10880 Transcript_10760/m.10880 type:complete len:185 (-) Transcript_10760:7-561(-)
MVRIQTSRILFIIQKLSLLNELYGGLEPHRRPPFLLRVLLVRVRHLLLLPIQVPYIGEVADERTMGNAAFFDLALDELGVAAPDLQENLESVLFQLEPAIFLLGGIIVIGLEELLLAQGVSGSQELTQLPMTHPSDSKLHYMVLLELPFQVLTWLGLHMGVGVSRLGERVLEEGRAKEVRLFVG